MMVKLTLALLFLMKERPLLKNQNVLAIVTNHHPMKIFVDITNVLMEFYLRIAHVQKVLVMIQSMMGKVLLVPYLYLSIRLRLQLIQLSIQLIHRSNQTNVTVLVLKDVPELPYSMHRMANVDITNVLMEGYSRIVHVHPVHALMVPLATSLNKTMLVRCHWVVILCRIDSMATAICLMWLSVGWLGTLLPCFLNVHPHQQIVQRVSAM